MIKHVAVDDLEQQRDAGQQDSVTRSISRSPREIAPAAIAEIAMRGDRQHNPPPRFVVTTVSAGA